MGITYRPEIDGLRAIAVLAVVLFHAGVGGAGFVGVDVFFVISGYLITSLLLKERDASGINLLAFYARRVRRIFPAAAAVVLAVLATSLVLLSFDQQSHVAKSAGAALVFGANVFFQLTSGGYWDSAAEEMPLLHLWSLSVEEQFYFLWPALLIAVPRRWLRQTMIALALASIALAEYWIAQGSDAAFYEMPARFWELAAGGLIASAPQRAMPRWLLPAGIVATLAACAIPSGHFPGIGALPAVLGAAAIIGAVHGGATNVLLRSRPMVGVGLISYSLYLWHWPLLAFYRATSIGEGSMQTRLILCAFAVVLAIGSYRYVEQPFRRMRFRSGRTVAVGATASAALALSACVVGLREPPPAAVDPFPLATQAERDLPPLGCSYNVGDTAFPKCPITARNAVWGDSMAYAWRPFAEALGPVADLSRQGCSPYLGWLPEKPMPADLKCRDFNTKVVEAVRGMDTVMIVARWQADRMPQAQAAIAAIAPHVRRVIVIGPTPEMRDEVPQCIRQHQEVACAISRAEFDASAKPVLDALKAAAKGNVEIVDVTDRFCTESICPPVRDGVPLYWDSHHVTSTVVRGLATRSLLSAVR